MPRRGLRQAQMTVRSMRMMVASRTVWTSSSDLRTRSGIVGPSGSRQSARRPCHMYWSPMGSSLAMQMPSTSQRRRSSPSGASNSNGQLWTHSENWRGAGVVEPPSAAITKVPAFMRPLQWAWSAGSMSPGELTNARTRLECVIGARLSSKQLVELAHEKRACLGLVGRCGCEGGTSAEAASSGRGGDLSYMAR